MSTGNRQPLLCVIFFCFLIITFATIHRFLLLFLVVLCILHNSFFFQSSMFEATIVISVNGMNTAFVTDSDYLDRGTRWNNSYLEKKKKRKGNEWMINEQITTTTVGWWQMPWILRFPFKKCTLMYTQFEVNRPLPPPSPRPFFFHLCYAFLWGVGGGVGEGWGGVGQKSCPYMGFMGALPARWDPTQPAKREVPSFLS